MKKSYVFLPFALIGLLFTTCSRNYPPQTQFVLGTVCSVNLFDKGKPALYTEIFDRLRELENILSANSDDSNLAAINKNAGISPVKANPETLDILAKALNYSTLTGGSFDPTIGPLVKLWNIGTESAAKPSNQAILNSLQFIDYSKVIINTENSTVYLPVQGMRLDLGAIAKGFAADEIVRILHKHSIRRAIIDLGGNVFAMGEKTAGKNWIIGIRNPDPAISQALITIPIINRSVVTSGTYERFFEENGVRYHHILDPATGFPVNNDLLSTTIIAPTSIDADALSTSTFLLGGTEGMRLIESLPDIEAVFIFSNHEIRCSSGLADLITIQDPEYRLIR